MVVEAILALATFNWWQWSNFGGGGSGETLLKCFVWAKNTKLMHAKATALHRSLKESPKKMLIF